MELNISNKRIEQLFAEFFDLDSSYIHQCYREFKDAYNQKISSSHEGFIPKQKQSWKIPFQEKKTLNHWENSTLIGVDLPLFFKCPESQAQTVMLVALDPLRNPDHFSDFKDEDVIIGTPFAQHSSYYREDSQKIVFDFIKHIVDKNYHMYVTDVYKVWMKMREDEKSHLLFKKNESTIFKQLLRKELDIIEPKIIITFGNDAKKAIEKQIQDWPDVLDSKPRHLHFIHPSGQARGAWTTEVFPQKKKELKIWSKEKWNRKILEYMNNEFDKYLN
jgi:hypothetical protein